MWATIEAHPVLFTFLIAFAARVLVALIANNLFDGALIQPDSLTYHEMARAMAEDDTANWDDFTVGLFWRTATFLLPLRALYWLLSPSVFLGGLYVGLLGAEAAAMTIVLARYALRRLALVPGLILALLPSQVFWSAVTLKDAMVWLLYTCLALFILRSMKAEGRKLFLYGVLTGIFLILLAYTRQHSFVIACWAVPIAAALARPTASRIAGSLVLAIALPLAVGFGPAGIDLITGANPNQMRVLNAENAESAFVELPSEIKEAQELERQASEATGERAEILRRRAAQLREDAAPEMIELEGEKTLAPSFRHLPRGLTAMLFEPFPWTSSDSTSLNLARLETLVWYPILLLAAIGLSAAWRHRDLLAFPLTAGTATLFVYALTEGNLGTAYRHRGEFVWVIALLAGFGVVRIVAWRRKRVGS